MFRNCWESLLYTEKLSHYTLRRPSYSFSTSAVYGGRVVSVTPRHALASGKGPPVPIVQETGWVLKPVWTQRLEKKSFRLCRGSNLDRPLPDPILTELPGSHIYFISFQMSLNLLQKQLFHCPHINFNFESVVAIYIISVTLWSLAMRLQERNRFQHSGIGTVQSVGPMLQWNGNMTKKHCKNCTQFRKHSIRWGITI
jgi:hypothetical protein